MDQKFTIRRTESRDEVAHVDCLNFGLPVVLPLTLDEAGVNDIINHLFNAFELIFEYAPVRTTNPSDADFLREIMFSNAQKLIDEMYLLTKNPVLQQITGKDFCCRKMFNEKTNCIEIVLLILHNEGEKKRLRRAFFNATISRPPLTSTEYTKVTDSPLDHFAFSIDDEDEQSSVGILKAETRYQGEEMVKHFPGPASPSSLHTRPFITGIFRSDCKLCEPSASGKKCCRSCRGKLDNCRRFIDPKERDFDEHFHAQSMIVPVFPGADELFDATSHGKPISVPVIEIMSAKLIAFHPSMFESHRPLVTRQPPEDQVTRQQQGGKYVFNSDRSELSQSYPFHIPEGIDPATPIVLEPEVVIRFPKVKYYFDDCEPWSQHREMNLCLSGVPYSSIEYPGDIKHPTPVTLDFARIGPELFVQGDRRGSIMTFNPLADGDNFVPDEECHLTLCEGPKDELYDIKPVFYVFQSVDLSRIATFSSYPSQKPNSTIWRRCQLPIDDSPFVQYFQVDLIPPTTTGVFVAEIFDHDVLCYKPLPIILEEPKLQRPLPMNFEDFPRDIDLPKLSDRDRAEPSRCPIAYVAESPLSIFYRIDWWAKFRQSMAKQQPESSRAPINRKQSFRPFMSGPYHHCRNCYANKWAREDRSGHGQVSCCANCEGEHQAEPQDTSTKHTLINKWSSSYYTTSLFEKYGHKIPFSIIKGDCVRPIDIIIAIEVAKRPSQRDVENAAIVFKFLRDTSRNYSSNIRSFGLVQFSMTNNKQLQDYIDINYIEDKRLGAFEVQVAYRIRGCEFIPEILHSRLLSRVLPKLVDLETKLLAILSKGFPCRSSNIKTRIDSSTVTKRFTFSPQLEDQLVLVLKPPLVSNDMDESESDASPESLSKLSVAVISDVNLPMSWRIASEITEPITQVDRCTVLQYTDTASEAYSKPANTGVVVNKRMTRIKPQSPGIRSSKLPKSPIKSRLLTEADCSNPCSITVAEGTDSSIQALTFVRYEKFKVGDLIGVLGSRLHPMERHALLGDVLDVVVQDSGDVIVEVILLYTNEVIVVSEEDCFSQNDIPPIPIEAFNIYRELPPSLDLLLILLATSEARSGVDSILVWSKLDAKDILILRRKQVSNNGGSTLSSETLPDSATVSNTLDLLITRTSFFRQVRAFVLEISTKDLQTVESGPPNNSRNYQFDKNGLLLHPISKIPVDIQLCYCEIVLNWVFKMFGRSTDGLVDIVALYGMACEVYKSYG